MDLGRKVLKHQNLSEEMRQKLLVALANQVKPSHAGGRRGDDDGDEAEGSSKFHQVNTRTVEEFKSISDGHILMCDSNAMRTDGTYDIVPTLSTTRLGVGRVAAPSMMDLCSSLQLM